MAHHEHPNERSRDDAERKAWNDFRDLTAAYLRRVRSIFPELDPGKKKRIAPLMELLKQLIYPFGEK